MAPLEMNCFAVFVVRPNLQKTHTQISQLLLNMFARYNILIDSNFKVLKILFCGQQKYAADT